MKFKLALLTCLLAVICSATNAIAQNAQRPAAGRQVRVRYDVPTDPSLVPYQKFVQSNKILEEFADMINANFRMPSDLTVTAIQCGKINAFYSPQAKAIQLCYEFVRHFNNLHINDQRDETGKYDNAEVTQALIGSIRFVMYHEVGHALVGILDLPITGREEDAVDQLATVVLLSSGDDDDADAVFDGAYTHLLADDLREANNAKMSPEQMKWLEANPIEADEHSLDKQRYFNTVCLAYGSDPKAFSDLVTDGLLPKARADRCPWEWKQISRSWQRLLAPFAIQ